MQEGNRSIELHLSLFRACYGQLNPAQGVAGMLLGLASYFVRAASKQNERQTNSDAQKDTTKCVFHCITCFPARESPACHIRFSHSLRLAAHPESARV